jgi:hypothetical protein
MDDYAERIRGLKYTKINGRGWEKNFIPIKQIRKYPVSDFEL